MNTNQARATYFPSEIAQWNEKKTVPFNIEILGNIFFIETIFRYQAGNFLIAKARKKNDTLLLKLYYGSKAKEAFKQALVYLEVLKKKRN